MSYQKSDLTVGVKRTLTRRYVGCVMVDGNVIAKDDKAYNDKRKALERAKLIRDLTWLDAVNQTIDEQSGEG